MGTGTAYFKLTFKKGESYEVALVCHREPVTDEEKAQGCRAVLRQDMRSSRREQGLRTWPSQYKAEFVRFVADAPKVVKPIQEGSHEFRVTVCQDEPMVAAVLKPFVADNATAAWEEAVRRTVQSFKAGDVHVDKLYGSVVATDNPDDTYVVPRRF